MDNHVKCVDEGTENCPCCLALTGECLICSRLAGRDCCDCRWNGVCVYNEFIQSGGRVNNPRNSFAAPVTAYRQYLWTPEETEAGGGQEAAPPQHSTAPILRRSAVATLAVGKGFAMRASRPGSFLFLRAPGTEPSYDTPISVMRADVEAGTVTVMIAEQGAKTKMLLSACRAGVKPQQAPASRDCTEPSPANAEASPAGGESQPIPATSALLVRGVYRSGIHGVSGLIGARGGVCGGCKTLIVCKGVGFAPALLLADWMDRKVSADMLIDVDKLGKAVVRDHWPRLRGVAAWADLRTLGTAATSSGPAAWWADYLKEGGYGCIACFTSEYYQQILRQASQAAGITAVFSNNHVMCCGEGICGACGDCVKMCKRRDCSFDR